MGPRCITQPGGPRAGQPVLLLQLTVTRFESRSGQGLSGWRFTGLSTVLSAMFHKESVNITPRIFPSKFFPPIIRHSM